MPHQLQVAKFPPRCNLCGFGILWRNVKWDLTQSQKADGTIITHLKVPAVLKALWINIQSNGRCVLANRLPVLDKILALHILRSNCLDMSKNA